MVRRQANSISVPMTASTVSAARVFAACAAWARRLRSSRTPKNTNSTADDVSTAMRPAKMTMDAVRYVPPPTPCTKEKITGARSPREASPPTMLRTPNTLSGTGRRPSSFTVSFMQDSFPRSVDDTARTSYAPSSTRHAAVTVS